MFALVLVDTSAAYFEGADENDKRAAGRPCPPPAKLTDLPGGPCVLLRVTDQRTPPTITCSHARGGFVAEMTQSYRKPKRPARSRCIGRPSSAGPDFAPLSFQLQTVTHEAALKTPRADRCRTVVALIFRTSLNKKWRPRHDRGERSAQSPRRSPERVAPPRLAKLAGWKMRDGQPYRCACAGRSTCSGRRS